MKTVEEFEQYVHDRMARGDDILDSIVTAPIGTFIDQVREQQPDYPLDNDVARAVLENSAQLGLHLQAIFTLVLGLGPQAIAEQNVHEMVHSVWHKVSQMLDIGNAARAALVEIHSAVTGQPLPPTPNPDGDTDFEFWAFERELAGKEVSLQATVQEILDALNQLKALAGITPDESDPPALAA